MKNMLKKSKFQIISPFASIYKSKKLKGIETEGLLGEEFVVTKYFKNLAYGYLINDNYEGWISLNDLGSTLTANHKVIVPKSYVYKDASAKSDILKLISIGSKLCILDKMDNNWAKVVFPRVRDQIVGYIPIRHIEPLSKTYEDWVTCLENLVNTPYKWGGRTSFGIDCSGLVQLSLLTFKNYYFPRNSIAQLQFSIENGIQTKSLKRGSLIFWDGHIAVGINTKLVVHSNAYHMNTKIEKYDLAQKRLKKICGEVKNIIDLEI